MEFCSSCGHKVAFYIPSGDNRERHICDNCDTIHYSNPRIITGSLPIHEGKVLLCKRAIEPRYGLWTLPAGFMENGETTEEGAIRETLEEACANVIIESLFCVYNIPNISQVYMIYLGKLSEPHFAAGEESLDVKLFTQEEIPWNDLAFPVMRKTLQHYFDDLQNDRFVLHSGTIFRKDKTAS